MPLQLNEKVINSHPQAAFLKSFLNARSQEEIDALTFPDSLRIKLPNDIVEPAHDSSIYLTELCILLGKKSQVEYLVLNTRVKPIKMLKTSMTNHQYEIFHSLLSFNKFKEKLIESSIDVLFAAVKHDDVRYLNALLELPGFTDSLKDILATACFEFIDGQQVEKKVSRLLKENKFKVAFEKECGYILNSLVLDHKVDILKALFRQESLSKIISENVYKTLTLLFHEKETLGARELHNLIEVLLKNSTYLDIDNDDVDSLVWALKNLGEEYQKSLYAIMIWNDGFLNKLLTHDNFDGTSNHILSIATHYNDNGLVSKLLNHNHIFESVMYEEQHNATTTRFVNDKYTEFRERLIKHRMDDDADGQPLVFDQPEKRQLRLVLKKLTHINSSDANDSIEFLLHQIIQPYFEDFEINHILTDMIEVGNNVNNPIVAETLIPLRNELFPQINGNLGRPREVHEDAESSMRALPQWQQDAIDKVKILYQNDVDKRGGYLEAIADLKKHLLSICEQEIKDKSSKALIITIAGEDVVLPLEWKALQAMRDGVLKSYADYKKALQVYYQNPAHTAYRYLSKPNPWMDFEALYVEHYQPAPHESDAVLAELFPNVPKNKLRHANFESYQEAIATFYLAVIDKNSPPIDGHTLETRLENFVLELASIGRAHNWDTTRPVTTIGPNGEVIYKRNKQGKLIQEEYDDNKPDKPTCVMGINTRLFQSVLGHADFKMLTKSIIEQEIKEFVIEYYRKFPKLLMAAKEHEAYLTFITDNADLSDEEYDARELGYMKSLASYDIPDGKQLSFFKHLENKYGKPFKTNDMFKSYVITRLGFSIHLQQECGIKEDKIKELSKQPHFIDFDVSNGLKDEIQKRKDNKLRSSAVSPLSFHKPEQPNKDNEEDNSDDIGIIPLSSIL